MDRKRLTEVDCLKGIGMLLVMLQHCISVAGGVESIPSVLILSFHMPLFFFASGLLYKPKKVTDLLAGRMASLLGPVVLYSLLNVFLRIILRLINHEDLYSVFAFAGFWFLLSLLFITVMQYGFQKILLDKSNNRKSLIIAFAALSLFIGILYSQSIKGKEVTIATGLVGWGFYLLGVLAGEYLPFLSSKTETKKGRIISAILGVFLLLVLLFTCQHNQPVFMYISEYGNALFSINASIGIVGVCLIAWALKHNRLIEFFGKNSLVILITHFPVHRVCVKVSSILFNNLWLVSILGFISSCLIELLIVFLINRYLPMLNGKIILEKEN